MGLFPTGNDTAASRKSKKEYIENGSMLSIMVADSETTFSVGRSEDPLVRTGKKSGKIFACASGDLVKSTEVAEVEHESMATGAGYACHPWHYARLFGQHREKRRRQLCFPVFERQSGGFFI